MYERLLLTGAAGALGSALRPRLRSLCKVLRVSDRADLGAAAQSEETRVAELADAAAMQALLEGVDAVVHFGGASTERPWSEVRSGNIEGVYNLYEAARKNGVKRIVYASSNHATGYHRADQVISPADPVRPDGLYGVSKAFGENLSRFYFDRYGVETACLRIGSCFPEPRDRRMLATWLSYDDLERLVRACLTAQMVGHTIIYGVSDNTATWWDNSNAKPIGFAPQDSSERFRAALEAKQPTFDSDDPAVIYQGGFILHVGPFDENGDGSKN